MIRKCIEEDDLSALHSTDHLSYGEKTNRDEGLPLGKARLHVCMMGLPQ